MRCPHGKKSKLYKRAKLEKFAPYLLKDGLVSRLSMYADREREFSTSMNMNYCYTSTATTSTSNISPFI